MNEKNIPLIHNYCDRWCEKCPFTNRCAVYEAERKKPVAVIDASDDEALWREIANAFSEAEKLLLEKASEFGVDLDAIDEEEFAEKQGQAERIVEEQELTALAENYAKLCAEVLRKSDEWLVFSLLEEGENSAALDAIHWYQYFIGGKLQRALSGALNFEGEFNDEEINDPQSDANGSAKIALIALERSISAWNSLMSAENADSIQPLLDSLNAIKEKTHQVFPKAKEFIRPGFDEIETVM